MQIDRVLDRLYGYVSFSADDLALFQTNEMARIRQVSLSAVPPWITPTGVCASRFEHSVGVAHLARIVGEKHEFREVAKELFVAALAHDIGAPPFSHASELFLELIHNKNHEEFAREMVEDSEFSKVAKQQGVDMDCVHAFIEGDDKPISDVINGSIDVDNLDNSLRFGLSMGIVNSAVYNPVEIANSYRLIDGELLLMDVDERDIHGWDWVRKMVYRYVYSEMNLGTGSMLIRAMDFAYRENELTPAYFQMTDPEAFSYLIQNCNDRTKALMEWARKMQFFEKVVDLQLSAESADIEYFTNANSRGELADEIAKMLSIEPMYVAVHLGRNKGFKRIHLPIVSLSGDVTFHEPYSDPVCLAQVYIHPKHAEKRDVVQQYVSAKLKTRS